MSSRRKASTPCMIRQDQTMVELDDETDDSHSMEVQIRCKTEDFKSLSLLMTMAAKYFII